MKDTNLRTVCLATCHYVLMGTRFGFLCILFKRKHPVKALQVITGSYVGYLYIGWMNETTTITRLKSFVLC